MADHEVDRILKEKFYSKFHGEYEFFGKHNTYLLKKFAKYAESIRNFEVYDDDVFVATYPKAGTTWTQEMVWMIANDLDYKKGQKNISERFPFLEICSVLELDEGFPEYTKNSIEFSRQLERPRFIKTHLPFSLIPEQIQTGAKKPKIVYVIRNPKDVCVSFYHHSRLLTGIRANLEEYSKVFLSGKVMYGGFWDHVFSYWEHRDSPNLLIIKYEDMKKDIKAVIKTVANFLNKEYTESEIDRLSQHLSFKSMKNNPSIDYDKIIEKNRKDGLTEDEGSFFRSGTVGQYKEELSREAIDKINDWTKKNISGTTFEKEYDYRL